MAGAPKAVDAVQVGRIFLDLENPRHVPFSTEKEAIEYLCKEEAVYPLARDIAKHGLNPLERFALIPRKGKGKGAATGYVMAEGNRRLCALKLLADPELAPAELRRSFEKIAEKWTPITTVAGAEFMDAEDARIWIGRMHGGEQGGIGRRTWDAEQKERWSGGAKNRAAQAFLDYAQSEGMISAAERKGKLTTVQRFVGNDVFSEVLGLDRSDPDDLYRTRPKAEFDIIAKRFIRDLIQKKDVNSRMNKGPIIDYSRPLSSLPGITTARIDPEPLSSGDGKKAKKVKKVKPKKPDKAKYVQYELEIAAALKTLGNQKLESLYHSICSVELDPHTPLVAVGVWAFFETLTACAGRNANTSFGNFLSKSKLGSYGITGDTLTLRNAMDRTGEYGNTTKHHPVAATFNGDQLNNDMVALKGVILACIKDAATKTT